MIDYRHIYILNGQKQSGKSIIGCLFGLCPSAIVLDNFVVPETRSEIILYLKERLSSFNPEWYTKINWPTFVMLIILKDSDNIDEHILLDAMNEITIYSLIHSPTLLVEPFEPYSMRLSDIPISILHCKRGY